MRAELIANPVYRYELRREWHGLGWPHEDGDAGTACWIMLNPSTADDTVDDPTIRKVIRLSTAHGFSDLIVVNLFAARSTRPKHLREMVDPVGPENDMWVSDAIEEADAVVVAWGAHDLRWSLQPELVLGRLRNLRRSQRLLCCGTNGDGSPKHPCYLPNDTQLIPFEVPPCRA